MKKIIIPVVAFLMIAVSANANPRLKNQKHFAKDFDPNKKVEVPVTSLAALNKGPQFKNEGHIMSDAGELVNVNDANKLKGPQYKNQKHFASPNGGVVDAKPEIAGR